MHDFALENNINIAQYIYLKYLFLDFFLIEDGFQACLPFQVSLLEVFLKLIPRFSSFLHVPTVNLNNKVYTFLRISCLSSLKTSEWVLLWQGDLLLFVYWSIHIVWYFNLGYFLIKCQWILNPAWQSLISSVINRHKAL